MIQDESHQNRNMNIVAVGQLLKAVREAADIQQCDIANQLGYRNANFISMIESERSTIPISKISQMVDAYQLTNEIALLVIRKTQPEIWQLINKIIAKNKKLLSRNLDELDRDLDESFGKLLKKHRLDAFLGQTVEA